MTVEAPTHPPAPYDPAGFYDEALEPGGRPRPAYAALLEELSAADLHGLSHAMTRDERTRGVVFGTGTEAKRFHVDPVPRIVERGEWDRLARGLEQRARALGSFLAGVLGARRRVRARGVPRGGGARGEG